MRSGRTSVRETAPSRGDDRFAVQAAPVASAEAFSRSYTSSGMFFKVKVVGMAGFEPATPLWFRNGASSTDASHRTPSHARERFFERGHHLLLPRHAPFHPGRIVEQRLPESPFDDVAPRAGEPHVAALPADVRHRRDRLTAPSLPLPCAARPETPRDAPRAPWRQGFQSAQFRHGCQEVELLEVRLHQLRRGTRSRLAAGSRDRGPAHSPNRPDSRGAVPSGGPCPSRWATRRRGCRRGWRPAVRQRCPEGA